MKTGFKIFVLITLFLLTSKSYGQCGAVLISADDTVICVPQVVKFKALNVPSGTTLEWNMGSGYVSSDSTFTNLFNIAGNYTISLRLTYADNSKCTIIKSNFIKGKAKPIITISTSLNAICNFNDSVTLTDNTASTYTRDWLLNNTAYKNGPQNLKVLYSYPSGYKTLTVFLKDSFGCSAKKTFDSIVYVADSVKLDFAADKLSGCIPKLINFTNLSDTAGNQISKWNWTFQNGFPLTSLAFAPKNIQFSTIDTFDVALKVTTKKGCIYSLKKDNYLKFADSLSLLASFSKTALCGSEQLKITYLNARSNSPGLDISPATYTLLIDSVKSKTVAFTDLGSYTFYISDEKNGCKSEKTYSNKVTVSGPLASFKFSNPKGCLKPDTFIGTNTSRVSSGVSVALKWNLYFDSVPGISLQTGTSDPFKAIAKYYANYTVKLVVSGSNGCKDSMTKVSAVVLDSMKPKFTWGPIPACAGDLVYFTNNTNLGSSKARNAYKWTFYNLNNSVLYKDTNTNPILTFPSIGSYSVKLLAYNSIGCKDSITLIKKIVIQKTNPKIEISDSSICVNEFSKFKATYTDTNYYIKYWHTWRLQHTDSANYVVTFGGDSTFVGGLWPGKYTVMYIATSKSGKCIDTFKLKTNFYVSGDRYSAFSSTLKGCNPFTTTLTATKLMTFNFINNLPNKSLFYWKSSNDTNQLIIANKNSLITTALVKQAGNFSFGLSYYNSSGCSDSLWLFTIASGLKANFDAPIYACVGKPIQLTNYSDPTSIKYKWFVKDSVSPYTFYPNTSYKDPKITFWDDGLSQIGLITYGNGQCSDTIYQFVSVNNIKAAFTSDDTLNYCAPVIVSVSALKNQFIKKYSWKFSLGDTITQNFSDISTLFSENTGPIGADVQLIIDAYGCSDTIEKLGFIKVIGPIPKFELKNNKGCEKLTVEFDNQSKYYNRFYLEYGDGTFLDSVNFKTHTYEIFDRSLSQQVFKPKLFVMDSLGCLSLFKPNDSVLVLRSPTANYSISNDTGCADFLVTFKNLSLGAISYKWDFDGDGVYDNFTPFPQKYYPAGDFKPILTAKALNGCEHKLENKYFIKSYAPPVATFVASQDSICYNNNVSFTGKSFPSSGNIKKWLWDFGNPFTYKDSATIQNPTYKFTNPYLNQVVLFVTDINNCTDTFDQYIYVNDTFGIVPPPINFVTVQNNNIFINWTKSSTNRFLSYNLYRDNSTKSFIDSFTNKNDTTSIISPVNVNNISYCYTINTLDKCKVKGTYAPSHCTVFLQVSVDVNKLTLDWTAYSGWPKGVEKYYIYRSENGGAFKLRDSAFKTTFVDDNLCNLSYCYYIVAVQKNGKWRSQSNTVCKMPTYIQPTAVVVPIRTTVLSDQSTYTQWQPYKFVKSVKKYHIARYYAGSSGVSNFASSDSTGFIDKGIDVNTNINSYTYTIRAEDHCGNKSPESNISKTILLSAASVSYVAKLKWTPYEKWFSGVKQYEIYIREGNSFNFLTNVDAQKNTFDYDYSDTKLDDSICFRINAIKDSSGNVTSNSNITCLVSDPQLWVPNAFTPNKDGNNEVFIPKAILIFNKTGNPILDYHLEIYNRWGEMVFESFDVNVGWDGTANNKLCQEGNYVYKIKALGLDGTQNFNLEGVITLLR